MINIGNWLEISSLDVSIIQGHGRVKKTAAT
jgi:hypothetical protein